ncbi:MAG TPA: aromatic ring-hydroxylating dioxygenase subunit alpha [Nitriliruptoraceae bacterium]|nr:aromatic ring-hydroxylating dioxygenase subunit alpha [Nitriliruptoraceae bacterium]
MRPDLDPSRWLREETYAATRLPVEQASTLIPDAYRSPAFHDLERETVWAGGWVAVGHVEQVRSTGDTLVGTVADQPIVVTRTSSGELRGFHNVCRHRAARLVDQDCQLRRFRCRYHSWTYALDGRLLGAPLFEGSDIPVDQQAMFDTDHVAGFDPGEMGLLEVRVDQWAHLVFANLDGTAVPLHEWLGDLPERLAGYRLDEAVIQGRQPYTVRANWKLVAENFMEYYHLPWVHPELAKVSRIDDHYRFQGPGMYTGMCTTPVTQDDDSGWSSLRPVPGLSGDDAVSGRFVFLFPSVALAVLPNHVFTIMLRPRGHDLTLEETSLALHADTVADPGVQVALGRLQSFWHHVNGEDIEVVEAVQAGIANRAYTGGRMCYRFEEPLHRFHNMVADRMVGRTRIPPGDDREDRPLFAREVST